MPVQTQQWLLRKAGGGPFRCTNQLPDSGRAQVFCGEDQPGFRFLLKLLDLEAVQGEPAWRKQFELQIRTLQKMGGRPGFPAVLDAGEEDGRLYLVTRFPDGGTLRKRMTSGPGGRPEPQPLEALFPWLFTLAKALDDLHDLNVAFGDLRPERVRYDAAGNVFLDDFGGLHDLIQGLAGGPPVPPAAPMYMAREQLLSQPPVRNTDQHALAVMAYEWLSGRPPFLGMTPEEVARAQEEPLAAVEEIYPGLPAGVTAALITAMAPDPLARHTSCMQLPTILLELSDAMTAGPKSSSATTPFPSMAATSILEVPTDEDAPPGTLNPLQPFASVPPLYAPSAAAYPAVPVPQPISVGGAAEFAPAPAERAPAPGRRRSLVGSCLRIMGFLAAMALAALAGSLFLPGTTIQQWAGRPLEPVATQDRDPGWLNPLEKRARDLEKERDDLVRRASDMESALRDAEKNLDKERKTGNDLSQGMKEAEAKRNDAEDQLTVARKDKAAVETELAAVKKQMDDVRQGADDDRQRAARAEQHADALDRQLDGVKKTMEATNLWFVMRNDSGEKLTFVTRELLWTGTWTAWTDSPHVLDPGEARPMCTKVQGAIMVQVRYNPSPVPGKYEDETLDIRGEIRRSDRAPGIEDVTPRYRFYKVDAGRITLKCVQP